MISEDEVARVAGLARLELSKDEIRRLSEQLSGVLGAFEHVSKVDTKGVEPLVTPTDMAIHFRVDEMKPWPGVDQALSNAPEPMGRLFKVPPVVG